MSAPSGLVCCVPYQTACHIIGVPVAAACSCSDPFQRAGIHIHHGEHPQEVTAALSPAWPRDHCEPVALGLQKTGMGDQWVLLPPRTSPVPLPPVGAVGRRKQEASSALPEGALCHRSRGLPVVGCIQPETQQFTRSEAERLPWGKQIG